mmetsp:Transcript_18149/g.51945  ORF Transcript_18149/g.51945 Transcript_18149/m.51945 type:complete len:216 (-) Transcript_18149:747-1394(-)
MPNRINIRYCGLCSRSTIRSFPSMISAHGTRRIGAVIVNTNDMETRIIVGIHDESGSSCRTSLLNSGTDGLNNIPIPFPIIAYVHPTIHKAISVALGMPLGSCIDSMRLKVIGTAPNPKTVTPNQLHAPVSEFGHISSHETSQIPLNLFSISPEANMTAKEMKMIKIPRADVLLRKCKSSTQVKGAMINTVARESNAADPVVTGVNDTNDIMASS